VVPADFTFDAFSATAVVLPEDTEGTMTAVVADVSFDEPLYYTSC
jgi:hypothetical protein